MKPSFTQNANFFRELKYGSVFVSRLDLFCPVVVTIEIYLLHEFNVSLGGSQQSRPTEVGQKSWEGRGLRKILEGGGVQFHEILQQICENLEGWSQNFQKMLFFAKFSHFLPKIFLGGV